MATIIKRKKHIITALSVFMSLLYIAGSPSAQTGKTDALDLAVGMWGTSDNMDDEELKDFRKCETSAVHITIDRENMRYKAVHTGEDFTSEGDILRADASYLSVRYDNEDRLMENGKPHIWHMVFVEHDKFYWVLGPGVGPEERDGVVDVPRVRCKRHIA